MIVVMALNVSSVAAQGSNKKSPAQLSDIPWGSKPETKLFDLKLVQWDFMPNSCNDGGAGVLSFDARIKRTIMLAGYNSVDQLIDQLANDEKTKKDIICYWNNMTVGDVAFIYLWDLFCTEAGNLGCLKTDVKEMDGMWQLLQETRVNRDNEKIVMQIKLRRLKIQKTFREFWDKNKVDFEWDPKCYCLHLKKK